MRIMSSIRSRRAAPGDSDDRGSMSMVMLIVIIGMGLGALMTPIVLTQNRGTTYTDTRGQALHEAQTGIDAMLGRLRNATADGGVSGVTSMLRCYQPGSPLTWRQSGSPTLGYDVTVQYYASDPLIKVVTSPGSPPATPAPISCVSGSGPVNVPSFARITSTGLDGTGNRTLYTIYAFNTTNVFTFNTANTTSSGGQIRLNPRGFFDVDETECLAATGSVPEVGMQLSVQACSPTTTPAPAAQLFFYNPDLSLQLAHSIITGVAPNGLCVSLSKTTNAVTLEACGDTSGGLVQQWSLNSDAAFVETPSSPANCLAVRPTGTDIVATTCQSAYDSAASWLPTPAVGSGAAGAARGQLVNFSQFGRCVQPADPSAPNSDANPLILYPCAQEALPSAVPEYQRFAYDSTTGHWATTTSTGQYCLTSQGITGQYVKVSACDITNSLQNWTDYGAALANQDNAGQWTYDKRYTIVDQNGLCMSLSPTSGPNADWFVPDSAPTLQYSKITSDECDGSAEQKWNTGPAPQSSTVKNTTEK